MVNILYRYGVQDSTISINPSLITGDMDTDRSNATLLTFKAGRLLTVDSRGYAALADGNAGSMRPEGVYG